jgi:hypothetical protein
MAMLLNGAAVFISLGVFSRVEQVFEAQQAVLPPAGMLGGWPLLVEAAAAASLALAGMFAKRPGPRLRRLLICLAIAIPIAGVMIPAFVIFTLPT